MASVTIQVPESTLSALRAAPHQLAAELPLAAAIHWYQQGRMSMERAAECAGLTRAAFLGELARRKVDVFVVEEDDLVDELRNG